MTEHEYAEEWAREEQAANIACILDTAVRYAPIVVLVAALVVAARVML